MVCQQGYLHHSLRHHAEEEFRLPRSCVLYDRMTENSGGGGGGFHQIIRRPRFENIYLCQPKVKIKIAWGYTCTSSWGVAELSTGTSLLSLEDILVYLSAMQLGFLFVSQ
jgi:hypothetical protein